MMTKKNKNESDVSEQENHEKDESQTSDLAANEDGSFLDEIEVQDSESIFEQVEELKNQVEEFKDGWQRSRAEFANYKKRVEREREQTYQNAKGELLKRYLDIADDLLRALNNRPENGEGALWAEGIELVYRKLIAKFESDGVTLMETDGKLFDPNLHEAISLEESDNHESGEIIEVLNPGYYLGDKVLRPATVRVAS
jgi:molecular chaperone GrpE